MLLSRFSRFQEKKNLHYHHHYRTSLVISLKTEGFWSWRWYIHAILCSLLGETNFFHFDMLIIFHFTYSLFFSFPGSTQLQGKRVVVITYTGGKWPILRFIASSFSYSYRKNLSGRFIPGKNTFLFQQDYFIVITLYAHTQVMTHIIHKRMLLSNSHINCFTGKLSGINEPHISHTKIARFRLPQFPYAY